MQTAVISAAALILIGVLVWALARTAHRQGVSSEKTRNLKAADDARKVRDEIQKDVAAASDDELHDRLRGWTRKD